MFDIQNSVFDIQIIAVQYKRIARPVGARPKEIEARDKKPRLYTCIIFFNLLSKTIIPNKQKSVPIFIETLFSKPFNRFCYAYAKPLTNLVSFDLLFEALFLWITFFLAKRSSIEITFDNNGVASDFDVVLLNLLIALRVVLAW